MNITQEIQEQYEQFNEIYPNQLEYKEPNQFIMTIEYELDDEISCHIPMLSRREIDIPLYYKEKEDVSIKYIQPMKILIYFDEKNTPYFQFKCPWLSIQDIQQIQLEIAENREMFGDELFIILYSILIDKTPTSLDLKNTFGIELSPLERIKQIVNYDYNKRMETIKTTPIHQCEICFEEYPPDQFIFLESCFHFFCHECLKMQLDISLSTGKKLECPFADCSCEILPYTLNHICDSEKISKYEEQLVRILIRKEGDDIFECPFCDSSMQVEKTVYETPSAIHCCSCERTYCSLCLGPNHNGPCKVMKLREYYFSENYKQHVLSLCVMKNLKRCPNCDNVVIKSFGCNKIVCFCGQMFCYLCLQPIYGYDHFGGNCPLFEETSLGEDEILYDIDQYSKFEKHLDDDIKQRLESGDTFPYFCEECLDVTDVPNDQLVIVCEHCKTRVCRHCDEKNIDALHIQGIMKKYEKMKFVLPEGYENWK